MANAKPNSRPLRADSRCQPPPVVSVLLADGGAAPEGRSLGFPNGSTHEEQESSPGGADRATDVRSGGEADGSDAGDDRGNGTPSRSAGRRGAREKADTRVRVAALSAALTAGESKAYRMGVLAAGAIYADAADLCCRERIENLRIAIAGRSVACEAPTHWPTRGEP